MNIYYVYNSPHSYPYITSSSVEEFTRHYANADALGRLLTILAAKGLLTAPEVHDIVIGPSIDRDTASFTEVSNESKDD